MNGCIKKLVFEMKEVQVGRPWIGSNFKRKLDVLSDEEFFKRPHASMHSVAELISHLTIWREETIRKLETGTGSITDSHPSNWKPIQDLRKQGRQNLVNLYEYSLNSIVEFLLDKEDEFLDTTYYDNDFRGYYTYSWLIRGMLQHDLYHLGQIGYVVKLLKAEFNPDSVNSL